jgi:hypothetical protein
MQKRVWMVVILVLVLSPVTGVFGQTDDELIARYEPLWKSLFRSRNGFSESEFAGQITIRRREIRRGQTACYFRVDFLLKMDWVEIPCQNQFLIQLSAQDDAYRQTSLPRDTWFSSDDIRYVVEKRVYNTEMDLIRNVVRPAFASREDAEKEIRWKTGIVAFFELRPAFFVPGKVPRVDGFPYLIFRGTRSGVPMSRIPDVVPDFTLKGENPARPWDLQLKSDGIGSGTPRFKDETGTSEPGLPDKTDVPLTKAPAGSKADEEESQPSVSRGPAGKIIAGHLNLISREVEFWDDDSPK